jgi:hypothetical protein
MVGGTWLQGKVVTGLAGVTGFLEPAFCYWPGFVVLQTYEWLQNI